MGDALTLCPKPAYYRIQQKRVARQKRVLMDSRDDLRNQLSISIASSLIVNYDMLKEYGDFIVSF
jgi:hypothetical protein